MKEYLFWMIAGYLSGSVLYCYWLSRWLFHVDIIQKSEDHNPGAYNAVSLVNAPFGVLCCFLDIMKGAIPVALASRVCDTQNLLFAFVIAAPVIGHAYPLFLKGKGGKAIAVSFGILLGCIPNLWMLSTQCAFFILFSILHVNPHSRRTEWAFSVSAAVNVLWTVLGFISSSYELGYLAISCCVIHKHRLADRLELQKSGNQNGCNQTGECRE